MRTQNALTISNNEIISIAINYLSEQKTVRLPLKGNSMRPFLEGDMDAAILALPHLPILGEPALVLLDGERWILHRIIRIDGEDITLQGDGNFSPEHCKVSDIRASIVGFYRKGRTKPDLLTGKKWRYYSYFWMMLTPVRRYLLFLYKTLLKAGIRI